MFVLINEIGLQNLPEGSIQIRGISRMEAGELLREHRAKGGIDGFFDVGAVPDERREAKFQEALDLLRKIDLPLTEADFVDSVEDERGRPVSFVKPPELCQVRRDRPILVVSYGYRMVRGEKPCFVPEHETVGFRLFSLIAEDEVRLPSAVSAYGFRR